LRLEGVPELAARARGLLGAARAGKIIKQSLRRGLTSARAEIVRDVRGAVPVVPRRELLSRIGVVVATDDYATFRIMGAGKHGRGYIRPRHLGLSMQRGADVAWAAAGERVAPDRAWVMSPLGGGDFAQRGSKRFTRNKALVFARTSAASNAPIKRINEPFTAGLLLSRGGRMERARRVIIERTRQELSRRLTAEAKRR